ncbi:MAG: 16S rRNA (guanine(527)-N(7))-methyltransferase RsmG [Bacteroidota bacterium]
MQHGSELIFKYFPDLSPQQQQQFSQLGDLYHEWNSKINVISRKDIDNLYVKHVLHSLAIARIINFKPGAHILDLGTGGGFPGIPLAILFPTTNFHLIDGTGKKIRVCQEVIKALSLTHCRAEQLRAEQIKGRHYDFIVTRAVARIQQLADWSFPLIKGKQQHAIPNGIIALKGKMLTEEMAELPKSAYREEYPISDWFSEDFFAEKAVIYLQY